MAQPQQRQPAPIHILPDVLFAPSDGLTYDPDEDCRVFAQQPVPGPILPFTYLIPSPDSELKPPTLRLGWRLGPFKLMELARRYFPDTIERCRGPPTSGMAHLEGEVEYPEGGWEEENDNIIETILGPGLAIALCSVLGIPSKYEEMVCVFPLYDSQLNDEYTLIIGSNYLGIPPPEAVAKLGEMVASVAPDVPLMWYLDIYKWKWHRVPPKPKGTRPKKVVQKKVVQKKVVQKKVIRKKVEKSATSSSTAS